MGDHAYAYRSGYSVHNDDDDDDGDKVCRTYVYDVDGRPRTVIGCSPYYGTTECYVVQTEVISSKNGNGSSPKKADTAKDYYGSYGGYDKYRPRPSSPSYYDRTTRPQEVNDFISGVQTEASKPNNNNRYSNPQNGSAFSRPTVYSSTTPGYGGYGDYRTGNNYGGYSSSEEDDDDEEYRKPSVNVIRPIDQPPIRPSPIYASDGGGSSMTPTSNGAGKVGMPTNSIAEAVDYLKGAGTRTEPARQYGTESVKPYGPVKPYGTYGSDYKSSDSVKPYGYGSEMKNTEPATPYGTYGSDRKIVDSAKPYGSYGSDVKPAEPMKPYSTYGSDVKNTESVKPYGTYGSDFKSTGSAKPYGTYGSKGTTDQVAKPYGPKYPISSTTGQPVIDCYEAARKYNGTVFRN